MNERQVKMAARGEITAPLTRRVTVRSINSDIRGFTVRASGAGMVTLSVDDQESAKSIDDAPLVGGMLTREDAIGLARALLEAAGLSETPSRDVGTFYIVKASADFGCGCGMVHKSDAGILCRCGQARLGQCSICR